MKTVSILLLALAASCTCSVGADERNTLIAVNTSEIHNDGHSANGTVRDTFIEYRVYNQETKKVQAIQQRGEARLLFLVPAVYCLHSIKLSEFRILRVANTGCFRVAEDGITNAGTWVIGLRPNHAGPHGLLIEMKENYTELESIIGVSGTQPAELDLPHQIIEKRDPADPTLTST